jgi:hypothetical protein
MRIYKLYLLLVFFFLFLLHVPPAYTQNCIDNDNDGYGVGADLSGCTGSATEPDCDDSDSKVHPRAREICDGKDSNCNGIRSFRELDSDGDGVPRCARDCNDRNNKVYPGAPELCDGIDNNCDRKLMAGERDRDQDGFRLCDAVPDCNDLNASVHPAAEELCDDEIDNNCNGLFDRDDPAAVNCQVALTLSASACTDNDGDTYSPDGGDCGAVDCDDGDASVNPGAAEVCDGKDTNCDGTRSWNDYDIDQDGFAVCNGDCNDLDAAVNPDAEEICGDGIDNNCNNAVDEAGCTCPDADGDGHPAAFCGGDDCDDTDPDIFENCPGCTDSDGDGFSVEGGSCGPIDCDDTDATVNPGEAEVCDGKDTNCDGTRSWNDYDIDEDSYAVCAGDCDNFDPNTYPGAPEQCDGKDNDCDSRIPLDERDSDGDGYRPCDNDCDDNDFFTNPGQDEWCSDGIDNNCNGDIDETLFIPERLRSVRTDWTMTVTV